MIGSIQLPYRGSIIFVSRFEANVGDNGGQLKSLHGCTTQSEAREAERVESPMLSAFREI